MHGIMSVSSTPHSIGTDSERSRDVLGDWLEDEQYKSVFHKSAEWYLFNKLADEPGNRSVEVVLRRVARLSNSIG